MMNFKQKNYDIIFRYMMKESCNLIRQEAQLATLKQKW